MESFRGSSLSDAVLALGLGVRWRLLPRVSRDAAVGAGERDLRRGGDRSFGGVCALFFSSLGLTSLGSLSLSAGLLSFKGFTSFASEGISDFDLAGSVSGAFFVSTTFCVVFLMGLIADAGLILRGGGFNSSSISSSGCLDETRLLSRSRSANASSSRRDSSSFDNSFLAPSWRLRLSSLGLRRRR